MTKDEYRPIIDPLRTIEAVIRDLKTTNYDLASILQDTWYYLTYSSVVNWFADNERDFPWSQAMYAESGASSLLDHLKGLQADINSIVDRIKKALDAFHESYETLALKEGKLQKRQLSKGTSEKRD